MVKRAKTPETVEGAKYYTCYKPYPANANFELPEDYIPFCRWIACVLGSQDPLYAVYYKPKARGMVQFSVARTYPNPERLLGEHRWSEFLNTPIKEEEKLVSQIFYSTYSTDREAQKDGWKCIFVEEHFFRSWSVEDRKFKKPYPTTHWCHTPQEDITEKSLCRPLPTAQVPKLASLSARPAPPVVGSAVWAQTKQEPAQGSASQQRQGSTSGNARGKGGQAASGRGKTLWDKPIVSLRIQPGPASGPSSSSFPTLGAKPPPKKAVSLITPKPAPPSAWAKPATQAAPPVKKSYAGIFGAQTSENAKPTIATTKDDTSDKSRFAPPGLTRTQGNKRASASPAASSNSTDRKSTSKASSVTSVEQLPSPTTTRAPVTVQVNVGEYDFDNDYDEEIVEETYHVPYAEDWETASVYAPSEVSTAPVRINIAQGKGKGREREKAKEVEEERINYWEDYMSPLAASEKKDESTNLWEKDAPIVRATGSVTAVAMRARAGNEKMCPVHGPECKKGICTEYAKLRREQREEEKGIKREEKKKLKREEEKRKKQEKRKQEREDGSKDVLPPENEGGEAEQKKDDGEVQSPPVSPDSEGQTKGKRWEEYSSEEEGEYFDKAPEVPEFQTSAGGGVRRAMWRDDDDEEFD
ncbi:hypothetical protein AX17_006880 [Amanita inopinata Kibby_2008]|nr:hypothetical protein AX17_006880 [Amanita inopinata Kibby_2008]